MMVLLKCERELRPELRERKRTIAKASNCGVSELLLYDGTIKVRA